MNACKYNVKEFAQFVSGKKKIVPEVSDDWEVYHGGFMKSESIVNLKSKKLNQHIFDISSSKFFEFMKDENVTMIGNKIQGRFVIGRQRVLRTEKDYLETMSTVDKRKSVIIPKAKLIVGHRYETVCGSTFIYIGTRWMIRNTSSEKHIKVAKYKKYYLGYIPQHFRNISNIGTQKIVKDLGLEPNIPDYQTDIDKFVKNEKIIYISLDKDNINITLDMKDDDTKGRHFIFRNQNNQYFSGYYTYSYYIYTEFNKTSDISYSVGNKVIKISNHNNNSEEYIPVTPVWNITKVPN